MGRIRYKIGQLYEKNRATFPACPTFRLSFLIKDQQPPSETRTQASTGCTFGAQRRPLHRVRDIAVVTNKINKLTIQNGTGDILECSPMKICPRPRLDILETPVWCLRGSFLILFFISGSRSEWKLHSSVRTAWTGTNAVIPSWP